MELYWRLKKLLHEQGVEALLPQNLTDEILNEFREFKIKDGSIESLNPLLFYVTIFREYNKDVLNSIPNGLVIENQADAKETMNFFRSNPDSAKKVTEFIGYLLERFRWEIQRRQEPWRVWEIVTKETILKSLGMCDAKVVYKEQLEQAIKLYKSLIEVGDVFEIGLTILASKTSAIRIYDIDNLSPEEKKFGGTAFFMSETDEGTRISVLDGHMGNIHRYLTPIQGIKLNCLSL